jgi:membrane protease YdiL (CAAX protease family)
MVELKNIRDLFLFFSASIILSWIVWIPVYLHSSGVLTPVGDMNLLINIGAFSPTVMALFLVYGESKKRGLVEFIKRGVRFSFSARVWILFLVVPFCASVAAFIGQTQCVMKTGFSLIDRPLYIIPVFILIVIAGGPLGEEFGWRGYALDRLNKLMDPFFSSIMLGVLWSAWQLPLFFLQGTFQSGTSFGSYFIVTIMLSLIMTVVSLKSGGSVGAAVLFHALTNLSYAVFSIFISNCRGTYFMYALACVTLIIVIAERRILFPSVRSGFGGR